MPVKITIEHVGEGWSELFRSGGVQDAVDQAGQRIAQEANAGYGSDPFVYHPKPGPHYARGYVEASEGGTYYQQRDKALSKAVHP